MSRPDDSRSYRVNAADVARARPSPKHVPNTDEQRFQNERFPMSFTKGLNHSDVDGLVANSTHFAQLRAAIDGGFVHRADGSEPFTQDVTFTLDPGRPWEAPTAGQVFDLEGPDSQAVAMPPAPALGSDELTFEMAEVYELALLRDIPFTRFQVPQSGASKNVQLAVDRLNALPYAQNDFHGRPRKTDRSGRLDRQTVFRGSSAGVDVGPYLSQFLLIGNTSIQESGNSSARDGLIRYGAQLIDQRVPIATIDTDYMTDEEGWLRVQNGGNTRVNSQLFQAGARRFITTPRDLATYVHDDALYQAYLNACLILLGFGAPFDPAFEVLAGGGMTMKNGVKTHRAAGGFALYGPPHVLSLVTEVATRALKAVRWQKFNVHLRLRPEALAARIHYRNRIDEAQHPQSRPLFDQMATTINPTLTEVRARNSFHNRNNVGAPGTETELLPMAFQEGSPMHPTYGAGHATVAGACVTMLKAFFDTDAKFVGNSGALAIVPASVNSSALAYVPSDDGMSLEPAAGLGTPLTVGGELNKLAANISIGRNMAGVHYFSDYFDSVRMGESVAIGILEEQALGYPTDEFVTTLTTFDNVEVRIGRNGATRAVDNQPYF